MSKMFKTLGPFSLKWCFNKSQIQQKLTYELKKQTNKAKVTKKNRPTKNHYKPTRWESTSLLRVRGILFKIE